MITVDFSTQQSTLFSGRKNGARAREQLIKSNMLDDKKMKFSSKAGQLITSSFFLGLLGDYLQRYNSIDEVIKNIDIEDLDPISREECLRALKRGSTKNQDLF